MHNRCGIIPALDLDVESIVDLVKVLGKEESIVWHKVGSIPVMRYGLKTICETIRKHAEDQPLMLDLQKGATDIPHIVRKQIEVAKDCGVDAFIGAPLGAGSNRNPSGTLETFVKHCKKNSIVPVVLMSMTQPGWDYFLKENALELIAERVCELEVSHVVLPANKPERIRQFRSVAENYGVKVSIISPGVGPQKTGNAMIDAVEAVKAGADYIVIGRSIYTSDNPSSFVRNLYPRLVEARNRREKES